MSKTILFETENHINVLFEESEEGSLSVQSNQHLIVHGGEAILLDPGGHKVFTKVMANTMDILHRKAELKYIFLSHADPDIVAAINGWLMTTDADAICSDVWLRFIPHFGVDELVADRLLGLPDKGGFLELENCPLMVLPAHYLHACGNFQLYDPVSKILYTGDLAASIGMPYMEVTDFDAHLPYMEGFHKRYMGSTKALKAWVKMVRQLEIHMIAPQHGAYFKGPEMVERFLNWADNLECGIDVMGDFELPRR